MSEMEEWMKPGEGMQPKIELSEINKTGSIISTELKTFDKENKNEPKKLVVSILLDGEKQARGLILGKQKAREFSAMVEGKTPDKWMGIKVRTIPYSVTYEGKQFMKVGIIPA
jgi:hypothetical protein